MPLFFGNIRGTQLLIIVLVILLLFGGRKIPELMKGLGKGVHSFKQGLEEAKAEMNKPVEQVARPEESEPKGKDRSE
jgi:sec-independent protein translocase protein TatA